MTTKIFLSHQLGKSKIIIDGKDMTAYVRSIDISQWGGDLPSIRLDLYIPDCEIEIENNTVEITSVDISQHMRDKIAEKILTMNTTRRLYHEQCRTDR